MSSSRGRSHQSPADGTKVFLRNTENPLELTNWKIHRQPEIVQVYPNLREYLASSPGSLLLSLAIRLMRMSLPDRLTFICLPGKISRVSRSRRLSVQATLSPPCRSAQGSRRPSHFLINCASKRSTK